MAGHDKAWLGMAWPGEAGLGKAWRGMAGHGRAGRGVARLIHGRGSNPPPTVL
jgi:hypothetical protein